MPRISQQVVEAYSLISLVAAGFGVALVPQGVQALARAGVIFRTLEGPVPQANVKMVYRPDCGAVAERFIGMAREFLEQEHQELWGVRVQADRTMPSGQAAGSFSSSPPHTS